MVSHDESSSIEYASRRIIIEEGKIIKDEVRSPLYKNQFYIQNGTLFLPFDKNLTSEEKEIVIKKLEEKEITKIEQINDGFSPFLNDEKDENFSKTLQKSTKIEKNTKNKLLKKYFKKGLVMSSLNSLLFALLTILLILVQTFLHFDSSKIILENIDVKNQQNVIISKHHEIEDENQFSFNSFNEEEINELGDKLISYPYINYSQSFSREYDYALVGGGYNRGSEVKTNKNGFYSNVFYGTAIVDEKYLNDNFNEGNEVEVLAGSLKDSENSIGLIVTDYFIDGLNDEKNVNEPYSNYLGPFQNNGDSSVIKFNISAIIKTNYREKYKTLLENYQKIKNNEFDPKEMQKLMESDMYLDYYKNVYSGELSTLYTLNQNFLEDIKNQNNSSYVYFSGFYIMDAENLNQNNYVKLDRMEMAYVNHKLHDNEICLKLSYLDKIANLFNTIDIFNKKAIFYKKEYNGLNYPVIKDIEVTIKTCSNSYRNEISPNLVKEFNEATYMEYARLVPLNQDVSHALQVANDRNYDIFDVNSNVYTLVYKTLRLYNSTFELVQWIVIALLVIYFSLNSVKTIKESKYQIGVFKSLGMDDFTISYIFSGKNMIFSLISILLIIILSYPFLYLANILIVGSYSIFMKQSLPYLNIFYFHPLIFLFNFILIFVIVFICSVLPLMKLKRITPAKIVNNRED